MLHALTPMSATSYSHSGHAKAWQAPEGTMAKNSPNNSARIWRRSEVARIEEGVDALERGLILLGSDGAVHWMSPLAARWLRRISGRGRDVTA